MFHSSAHLRGCQSSCFSYLKTVCRLRPYPHYPAKSRRISCCCFDDRKYVCCSQATSTRIQIFLNPYLFLSGYGFRPHVSDECGIRICSVLNPLSAPEWKVLSTLRIRNRVDAKSGYFLSVDVRRSSPSFTVITIFKMATQRTLCCQYSQRSPGH